MKQLMFSGAQKLRHANTEGISSIKSSTPSVPARGLMRKNNSPKKKSCVAKTLCKLGRQIRRLDEQDLDGQHFCESMQLSLWDADEAFKSSSFHLLYFYTVVFPHEASRKNTQVSSSRPNRCPPCSHDACLVGDRKKMWLRVGANNKVGGTSPLCDITMG